MKSSTLVAIGIGIGLGLMALIAGAEAQAPGGVQAPSAQHRMQQLLARMGHDSQTLSPAEWTALMEPFASGASGTGRHSEPAVIPMGAMGQGFSAEDLLLLQGFAQMFGAQGYAGQGASDSTGYSGGGSFGYGQLGYGGYGGGDNFYSSRVGTGNHNADNSAGYVYIPGTGGVSYGM